MHFSSLFFIILAAIPFSSSASSPRRLNHAAFSFDEAKLACGYAGAAYCSGHRGKGVEDWSFKYKDWGGMKKLNATSFYGPVHDTNGYVGFDGEKSIWASFAGTDPLSIRSWLDDLNFPKTTDHPACSDCKVHEGFLESWNEVKAQVISLIKTLLSAHPKAKVHITGHSLGAAIATLALVDLIDTFGSSKIATVYNFGSPRVGNTNFSEFTDSLDVQLYRTTHGHDPVPHLPPEDFIVHFRHAPREVFWSSSAKWDASAGKMCDGTGEDPTCADANIADIWIPDHLSYYDFPFTTNYLSCKF